MAADFLTDLWPELHNTMVEVSLQAAAESQVHGRIARSTPPLSFRGVYREHYTYVWRSLMRLGVHEAAVDDAVQDVFIVVHRKLDAFEGRAAVRTWLFAIARRIALRYRDRARRSAVDEVSPAEAAPETARPDRALSCNETLQKLQSWLDELDEDKRSVFVLSEFEQLRAPEIANKLGVNLNTVYARLRAARQHVSRRARREDNLETYRASVRSVACVSPPPASRGRTWGLLIAKLGIAQAAVATAGVGASAGIVAKLALAAAVVGGGSMAIAAIETTPPPRTDQAIAGNDGASVGPAAQPPLQTITRAPSARPPAPRVAPATVAVSPAGAVPLAPSAAALLSPRRAKATRKNTGSVSATGIESKPEPFAAELERFEEAKVASRRGDTRDALDRIDRYVREFPRGTFAIEATALRVRTLCKAQRTEEARKEAAVFLRSFPSSKLIDADAPCG